MKRTFDAGARSSIYARICNPVVARLFTSVETKADAEREEAGLRLRT